MDTHLLSAVQQTNWPEVATRSRELLAMNAKDHFAHWALGLYHANGFQPPQWDAALHALEKALELAPDSLDYATLHTRILLASGKIGAALARAQWLADKHPNNASVQIVHLECVAGNNQMDLASNLAQEIFIAHLQSHALRGRSLPMVLRCLPVWDQVLQGNGLRLRRITQADGNFVRQLRQDRVFQRAFHAFQQPSEAAIKEDLALWAQHPLDSRQLVWLVERLDGAQPLGLVCLVDLIAQFARAELLVGFPGDVPNTVSLIATLLAMEHAFTQLGLDKLTSVVYGDNPHAQKSTLHLGFSSEGLLRSSVVKPGSKERTDVHVNGLLFDEFMNNGNLERWFTRALKRPMARTGLRALHQMVGMWP